MPQPDVRNTPRDFLQEAAVAAWEKWSAGWWPFGQQPAAPAPTPAPAPAPAPIAAAVLPKPPAPLPPPTAALPDGVYRPLPSSPAPAPIKVPAVPGQNLFDQVGRLNTGAGRWLNRMYTPETIPYTPRYVTDDQRWEAQHEPYARGDAHRLIQQHVAQHNAEPAYRQDLAQRFQTLGAQPRTAYSLENVWQTSAGGKGDNVRTDPTGHRTDPRIENVSIFDDHYDDKPDDIVTKRMQVSSPTQPVPELPPPVNAKTRVLDEGKIKMAPITNMNPNLVGLHELQHVNQGDITHELPTHLPISNSAPPVLGNSAIEEAGPSTFAAGSLHPDGYAAEPAAVLTELAHGADAARNATHTPVEGQVALTPQYQPKLDWLRQQAQQHGIFSGAHTVQDQLNTPAGQAWLRMQYDQLAPPQGYLYDQYMRGNAQKLQNAIQDGLYDSAIAGLPEYMRQDLPKYLTKQNSAIATAAGKAWAKQADLLPGVQLQDHQQRISDRVTGPDPRMLVYHGLGSGKSLSALAAAEAAQKMYGGNYGIVAPASLRGNFEKEIKKFTTSNPEVMSYTGLGMGKQFKDQPETLVMDEAARLRNPGAASTRAAMRAASQADRLMLLTGTPITNEPKDLAGLISMLQNKQMAPEDFDKEFVGQEKVWPGLMGWLRGAKSGVRPVMRNGPKLRKLLEGHVDYQPSKTPEGVNVNEEVVRVPLSEEQKKIQKAIRTRVPPGFLWKLDHEFPLSRDELSKLNSFMTGFRQLGLSTQPFRADKDPLKAFHQSAKMQEAFKRLKSVLDSDPRKKAIIYSNFVDAGLSPYAAGLTEAGIPNATFHGSISPKVRQAAVDAYNQNKLRALLIGPAGAEGLSTKGTSLIQLMDPHWNEARSQQAQGRGLRFDSHTGLPEELRNVAVQRYIASSQDPSMMGKLMGYKRERTGDEVLERLTAEKEHLNEQFRKILREVGTQSPQKTAGLVGLKWACQQ